MGFWDGLIEATPIPSLVLLMVNTVSERGGGSFVQSVIGRVLPPCSQKWAQK